MQELPDLIAFAAVMLIVSIPILGITVGRPLGRAWAARLVQEHAYACDLVALETRLNMRGSYSTHAGAAGDT